MKNRILFAWVLVLLLLLGACHAPTVETQPAPDPVPTETALTQAVLQIPETVPRDTAPGPRSEAPGDATGFVLLTDVIPDAILEIRYYSTYNFVGERIDGYEEPCALLTREAAQALKAVSDALLEKGYRLKIFDAYRPRMAVEHFVRWAQDPEDTRMQEYFYPELRKDRLFPEGYIATRSGHSRGSTVDLTLVDMATGREVDMGGPFDFFGEKSHGDYENLTAEQKTNRQLLKDAMTAHGFRALATEWWHFTLEEEPYPDLYFTFPVSSDAVLPME